MINTQEVKKEKMFLNGAELKKKQTRKPHTHEIHTHTQTPTKTNKQKTPANYQHRSLSLYNFIVPVGKFL